MSSSTVSNHPIKRAINNVRLPFMLLVIAAVLVLIAQIARPTIEAQPNDWKVTYVLVTGLPFIMEFIALILTFVFVIFVVAKWLNNRISPRAYQIVEWGILACVALGMIGMFQPWEIQLYNIGFHLLLVAFVAFNVWSHVTPKPIQRMEEQTGH